MGASATSTSTSGAESSTFASVDSDPAQEIKKDTNVMLNKFKKLNFMFFILIC